MDANRGVWKAPAKMDAIVSKYVGETEKNLSKLFGNAEFYWPMLFFDEAVAFVG